MKKIICLIILTVCNGQYTLIHDGLVREYYVSYPGDAYGPCPLIINMHGFGQNASGFQPYAEMDQFALQQGIAVVYPQGINNSWNVGVAWDNNNSDDVGFIRVLIDSVAANFIIDLDRVYACGMSNGGYMAYELACHLSDKIAAFGSVTGNFMLDTDNIFDYPQGDRKIPIVHFHGTWDNIVGYYPPSFDGSMTVWESIEYWTEFNGLDQESMEILPDVNLHDGTNVEKYTFYANSSNVEFIHYKVNYGWHVWFGQYQYIYDIHASEELINFFMGYKLSDFTTTEVSIDYQSDWGLVGLPLEVENPSYTELFPDAVAGTLYSFNDGYNSEETLIQGNGYLLRFNNAGTTTITGIPITELSLSLSAEWNLISGISTPMSIDEIIDPENIIISGTFYGFENGYVEVDELIPGGGYWVRANNSGNIILMSE